MRYYTFNLHLRYEDITSSKVKLREYSYENSIEAVTNYLSSLEQDERILLRTLRPAAGSKVRIRRNGMYVYHLDILANDIYKLIDENTRELR